ncbi:MAG: hypothetical protein WA364_15220 [Candidatus Nitrosopolaris sp.]
MVVSHEIHLKDAAYSQHTIRLLQCLHIASRLSDNNNRKMIFNIEERLALFSYNGGSDYITYCISDNYTKRLDCDRLIIKTAAID